MCVRPETSASGRTWHRSYSSSQSKKTNAPECTKGCVKQGAKYVFVNKGKVYTIENQNFVGLEERAGHTVKLTGEINAAAKTVKVSNIAMSSGGKEKKKQKY